MQRATSVIVGLTLCMGTWACRRESPLVLPPPPAQPTVLVNPATGQPFPDPPPVAFAPRRSPPPRPRFSDTPAQTRRADAGARVVAAESSGSRAKKPLSREELQRTLDAALGSMAACFASASPTAGNGAWVSFDADPAGRATHIKVKQTIAEVEKCITAVIAALKLPTFDGATVPIDYPVAIHRPTRSAPATTAVNAHAAEPTPQPIFVQPTGSQGSASAPSGVFVQP